MRLGFALAWTLACVLLVLGSLPAAAGVKEEAAIQAARQWLALVDAGRYGESWDQSASLFRGAVSREGWTQQIAGVRAPLGAVRSRKLVAAKYASQLPGAPDGEYVVIQLSTSFTEKASAIETITPMLDDGVWKVSGYYIR